MGGSLHLHAICIGDMMRYRPSYCVFVILVLMTLVVVLLLAMDGPFSSSRMIRSEEVTTFVPSREAKSFVTTISSYRVDFKDQFNNQSRDHASASQINRLIIKGKPYIPPPSPRSPIPLSQPTPSHPTLPTKQLQFFLPEVVKSTEAILDNAWVTQLQELLRKVHSRKQVSIVFSNSDYLETLLNWLIVAKVRLSQPITNVLVICLDKDVFSIISQRNIPSVYINPSSVVNITRLTSQHAIWMVRFVVFRLINYWGYDLVSYDSDAIIMKNPQELFKQHRSSDIVGSAGKFPYSVGKKWEGFTVCVGVVMFRSTPRTGKSFRVQVVLGVIATERATMER